MIQDIGDQVFDNHFEPKQPQANDYVLHFRGREALVSVSLPGEGSADGGTAGEQIALPRLSEYPVPPVRTIFAFSISGQDFFLALDDEVSLPKGFSYQALGWLRAVGPRDLRFAAVTAAQLASWYRDNRFCSRCGHPTELAPVSREIVCPSCGKIVYPKIQPGVIVGVIRDGKLLLTHYAAPKKPRWALVAGFTEIGETLEQTVQREVFEEVGLRVQNLRYYKSQPWSFSETLLAGFWCEVADDAEPTADGVELAEARFFAPQDIGSERRADQASLTGEMIELFRMRGAAVLA